MARSAIVWAAALLLASMSGSSPMLTTAEAMPAPGPQQTQMRPRYYFPRHVKRQIVTNSTAPAAATSSTSSSSSSSSSHLDTRQSTHDFSSFVNSFLRPPPPVQQESSSSVADTSTVNVVTDIRTVIPVPVGTGDPKLNPSSSTSSPYVSPTPTPPRSPSSSNVGSTAGIPSTVIPSTSAAPSSTPDSSSESTTPEPVDTSTSLPKVVVPSSSSYPATSSPPVATSTAELSSAIIPSVGTTLGLPSSIVIPSVVPSVGSTEGIPSTGIIPSSVIPANPTSTSADDLPITTGVTLFGPFIIPSLSSSETVSQPSSSAAVSIGSTGGIIPSDIPSLTLPSSIVLPTSVALPSTDIPSLSLPSSGIIVGITTAFGTTESPVASPTYTDSAIPTSESVSSDPLPLPSLVSSLVSDLSSILQPTGTGDIPTATPSGVSDTTVGPTAPTITPSGVTPTPISLPNLSSIVSVINSDVSSLFSQVPTASVPDVSSIVASVISSIASDASSVIVIPTATGSIPTPSLPISSILSSIQMSLSDVISTLLPPTATPTGVFPSSTVVISGSVVPSASTGTGVVTGVSPSGSSVPTPVSSSGIPVSETLSNSASATGSSLPSSLLSVPPSPTNGTGISLSASEQPASTPTGTPSSSPLEIPFTFTPTQKPTPPASVPITGTDSATTYIVGTSIIQEPTTIPSPLPTASGIPSDLPNMIAPPSGLPTPMPNAFRGQIGFNWRLNYQFVSENDGGRQIFTYLPMAIADALNISLSEVPMVGLKPYDTMQTLGYVTTLALFYIPADLNTTLAAQLRAPQAPFWHNKNSTVNDLTSLINTGISLYGGPLPGDGSPSQPGNPETTETGGNTHGGAIGGDMDGSHRVNSTAVGIAVGTIAAAAAYGTAMIFVARRYRNRKLAHKRTSSVPSSARYTYGSVPGGAAWMSGGRGPGRLTPGGPGSRGSRGSSSSNGRSIRTQQISAPVMAENSLGWN